MPVRLGLQRAVPNLFVDRQVIVPRRTEGVEHPRWQQSFHAVRNIAAEIKRVARGKLVRHAIHDESHLTLENMNDLLLRMRMRRHGATGGQCGHHLIHVFAMSDGPARDAWTNFDGRIFGFHFQNLTRIQRWRER